MSVVYYHYENQYVSPTIPAWATTWPGDSGCSNRSLSHIARTPGAPPSQGSPLSYNPDVLVWSISPPPSSGKTGGIPPYRFTNYRIGQVRRQEHLVRAQRGINGLNLWYQFGKVTKLPINCTPVEISRKSTGPAYSTYDEVTRDAYLQSPTYNRSLLDEATVMTESQAMRNELIAEAAQSYDLLTEIAQMSDIPKTILGITKDIYSIYRKLRSRHGYDALKRASTFLPIDLLKHHNKVFRKIGDEWLGYRYGIMPLVYSIHDIVKTINRGQEIRTRKSRTITPTMTDQILPGPSNTYLVTDVTGSVTLRGEVFQFFSSNEIARLSGVGINPIVTAWEMIPYSFVLDWFVDVGSYLTATVNQSWAQQRWACTSRRYKLSRNTWVHLPARDYSITISNVTPTNWWGAAPPANPDVVMNNPAGDYILNSETVDLYYRNAIPVTSVAPVFNPSLSWRRLIDGTFLSLNQLGRFFKRLTR